MRPWAFAVERKRERRKNVWKRTGRIGLVIILFCVFVFVIDKNENGGSDGG